MDMAPLLLLVALLCVTSACAQEPQWMGAAVPVPTGRPVSFAGSVELPVAPDRALLRVAAYDRYRLSVNGQGVSVGDPPLGGETYDVTRLLAPGRNTVEVAASSDTPAPRNCWIWLRRTLPAPGNYDRLTFRTRGARADEWLYVEVVDADGNTAGLYCPERDHGDFALGFDGQEESHVIDLRGQRRLDYRPWVGDRPDCDFSRLASVGIRVDQKEALATPTGQVVFSSIRLEGEQPLYLSDASGWRLERGVGEHLWSTLEAAEAGTFTLRYDFTSGAGVAIAVDLRAWREGTEIARLTSGPNWLAGGAAARLTTSPVGKDSRTPVAISGPAEPTAVPRRAGAVLDLGGRDRCAEGETLAAGVRVLTLEPMPQVGVEVWAENWSGQEVFRQRLSATWEGCEGRANFTTPALPRGLYRFTVTLDGQAGPERHAALAVLAPGQTRLSSIYDTLTPLPRGDSLHGIDTNWGDNPALPLIIRDQGANFVQVHLGAAQLGSGEFGELLTFCRATGLRFALNNEECNWVAASPTADGGDRFAAAGGCHRWDLEAAALDAAAATGLFEGVVYDEGEHMQMCRNYYANLPDRTHRKPYLVETTGMTLPQAREAFTEAARGVSRYNREHGARMLVESVFPALWHPLAEAGVTLCPKLLKEDIHPVVLALALGAAKQHGAELWFSPDLWYLDQFPGHSAQEYAAALRLAHVAGVDNVYTEGVAALFRLRGATYELTDYGMALRDFLRDYVPAHPRDYTYRDYEPEVAIIRFPDSDWGQTGAYWPTLYGAENLPPTAETGEWLQVWHLLTGGTTDPRAVNANNMIAYPRSTLRFCYPSPPVAVYDDRVGDGPLATVDTLFVCGVTVSEETLAAVRRRVSAGATGFIAQRLCPDDVRAQAGPLPARVAEGKGAWVVVGGFRPEDLGEYAGLVPAAGESMRLRFKGREVEVPEVGEP
jgi:hypothetical protein